VNLTLRPEVLPPVARDDGAVRPQLSVAIKHLGELWRQNPQILMCPSSTILKRLQLVVGEPAVQ